MNAQSQSLPAQSSSYRVTFDGGSIGNPGIGYGSYELVSPTGRRIKRTQEFPELGDRATNNQAEYLALIRALEHLNSLLGVRAASASVAIYGDSRLVIEQLSGRWKVKHPALRALHDRAQALLAAFGSYQIQWHKRWNSIQVLGH